MNRTVSALASGAAGWLLAAPFMGAHAQQIPDYVAKAVADPARAADRKIDGRRRVAQVAAFSEVKPGDKVLELIPGSGYFTRVFSKVVGPKGHVYTVWPREYDQKPDKFRSLAAEYGNIDVLVQPAAKLTAPEPVDLVFTSQNYHDYPDKFMGSVDPAVLNKAVFDALKPGGLYVVIDHAAETGSGMRDTETLHRIDPAIVKRQVLAAGFQFVGESDVLRNPNDDHKLVVFNPAIRGHTDQFAYKFRKPASAD